MAEARWLKGSLTGSCVGKPTRKVGGSGLARWYQLKLVDAVVTDWTKVSGPPTTAPAGPAPFCQGKLEEVRLRALVPGGADEELALRELSVWDWKVKDQREGGGESRCTLVGTVYAQEVEGTRRPALAEGADRLDRWGCLGLLLGLLVASWLWWSCGPFTCGLWASVVGASWWSHRRRTRRRTPPGTGSKVAQGVLALVLIVAGVGLVLGLADPSRAAVCDDLTALSVPLAVGAVVAASLFTVSWPLPWAWTLWTIVVVLWCGRAREDCVRSLIHRLPLPASGERGRGEGLTPTPSPLGERAGERGSGGLSSGTESGGTGSGGTEGGGTKDEGAGSDGVASDDPLRTAAHGTRGARVRRS